MMHNPQIRPSFLLPAQPEPSWNLDGVPDELKNGNFLVPIGERPGLYYTMYALLPFSYQSA